MHVAAVAAGVWVALTAAAFASSAVQAAVLTLSCTGVGTEADFCHGAAREWARLSGNEVRFVTPPGDASERLALYQQLLAAGTDRIDVLQIDVAWPGLLARSLLDLKPYARGATAAHFDRFIANNTVDGRLVALPWFANAGLLYYRRDLLDKYHQPVPTTWAALTTTAALIQTAERQAGHARLWGYVWQGRAYEGLTCNALEWIASHNGGTVVDAAGRITVDNPAAVSALKLAASWVGTITPTAVLNYAEESSRLVFQSGDAVFMRNWPYAWALAQAEGSAVRGRVGVAALPAGGPTGRPAATLGGESLAVPKHTRYPAEAASLVLYLSSAEVQKDRALRGAFNPTIRALYRDPTVLAANPFMAELEQTFAQAVARPTAATGARYSQVSHRFWNTTHDVLAGRVSAEVGLRKLDRDLRRLSRGGQWK